MRPQTINPEPQAPTDQEIHGTPCTVEFTLAMHVPSGDPDIAREWAEDTIMRNLRAGDGDARALLDLMGANDD